jgi:hypothetical protein
MVDPLASMDVASFCNWNALVYWLSLFDISTSQTALSRQLSPFENCNDLLAPAPQSGIYHHLQTHFGFLRDLFIYFGMLPSFSDYNLSTNRFPQHATNQARR